MEKFYIKNIKALPDPRLEPFTMEGLSDERREKCLRYIKEEDRKSSLGAGLIIKTILEEVGRGKNTQKGENGKPLAPGIFFNISHSGEYVIGVAGDTAVGCDIEKMKKAPFDVADRYFDEQEKNYIMCHEDKTFAFWQMWTLKESYMKMTGEGMRLPLNSFRIVVGKEILVYRDNKKQECAFRSFVYDGHMIAICNSK